MTEVMTQECQDLLIRRTQAQTVPDTSTGRGRDRERIGQRAQFPLLSTCTACHPQPPVHLPPRPHRPRTGNQSSQAASPVSPPTFTHMSYSMADHLDHARQERWLGSRRRCRGCSARLLDTRRDTDPSSKSRLSPCLRWPRRHPRHLDGLCPQHGFPSCLPKARLPANWGAPHRTAPHRIAVDGRAMGAHEECLVLVWCSFTLGCWPGDLRFAYEPPPVAVRCDISSHRSMRGRIPPTCEHPAVII